MKIFLSWSGDRSRYIAECLNKWIPRIIQNIDIWFSKEDIPKGQIWFSKMLKALMGSKFGIICLTPDNLASEWLHFETGAILKEVEEGAVYTLLYGIQPRDVEWPLAAFQHTTFEKEDFKKLLIDINKANVEFLVKDEVIEFTFKQNWDEIKAELDAIPSDLGNQMEIPLRSNDDILLEILESVRNTPHQETFSTQKQLLSELRKYNSYIRFTQMTGNRVLYHHSDLLPKKMIGRPVKKASESLKFRCPICGTSLKELDEHCPICSEN